MTHKSTQKAGPLTGHTAEAETHEMRMTRVRDRLLKPAPINWDDFGQEIAVLIPHLTTGHDFSVIFPGDEKRPGMEQRRIELALLIGLRIARDFAVAGDQSLYFHSELLFPLIKARPDILNNAMAEITKPEVREWIGAMLARSSHPYDQGVVASLYESSPVGSVPSGQDNGALPPAASVNSVPQKPGEALIKSALNFIAYAYGDCIIELMQGTQRAPHDLPAIPPSAAAARLEYRTDRHGYVSAAQIVTLRGRKAELRAALLRLEPVEGRGLVMRDPRTREEWLVIKNGPKARPHFSIHPEDIDRLYHKLGAPPRRLSGRRRLAKGRAPER